MQGSRHASQLIAERGDTEWDLVALGDSTPTGYGIGKDKSYVQIYAGYIEEDLEVNVTVHNWATNDTRRVADWVEEVRTNEELREDLRNAEVITLWLGWHDVLPEILISRDDSSIDLRHELDAARLREITSPMEDAFDQLLSEILTLANPEETLILIADVGIPALIFRKCREYGILDLWKELAYEVWCDYIIKAARMHGIHVAHTYEVINGVDGNQETRPEYMQSDCLHFNEEGHKLIASIHREVGYDYSGS